MSYTTQTLLAEEKILHQAKPHYVIFFRFVFWLLLAFFGYRYLRNVPLGSVMLIAAVASIIKSIIYYFFSEYAITNKRILVKVGFIRRRSLEIFLNRVEGVYIDQSILGRILNFGTIVVAGIGGTKNPFYYIPDPLKFRSQIQKQIQTNEQRTI